MVDGGVPCVIYMHGNASCRAEALQVLAGVLASGASVFAFDFAGCGMSEGDFISLGWFEKDDLAGAIEYLRNNSLATAIALWGRSMGAACSVLHASRDPSLAGIILDSPFASLEQVAVELVATAPQQVPGTPAIPSFLVKTALWKVASTVKTRAGFDLYKLRPVDAAKTCFVPALFGAGTEDVLVRPHHSKMIFDEFAGDKNMLSFDGDHNDLRPDFFIDSACIFLKNILLIPENVQLEVPSDHHGRPLSIRHAFRGPRPTPQPSWPNYAEDDTQQQLALAQAEEAMVREAIMASIASNPPTESPTPSLSPASIPPPPAPMAVLPPPPPTQMLIPPTAGRLTAALGISTTLAGSTRGLAAPTPVADSAATDHSLERDATAVADDLAVVPAALAPSAATVWPSEAAGWPELPAQSPEVPSGGLVDDEDARLAEAIRLSLTEK